MSETKTLTPWLPTPLERVWRGYLSPAEHFVLAMTFRGYGFDPKITPGKAFEEMAKEAARKGQTNKIPIWREGFYPRLDLLWYEYLSPAEQFVFSRSFPEHCFMPKTTTQGALEDAAGTGWIEALYIISKPPDVVLDPSPNLNWVEALNCAAGGGHNYALRYCEWKHKNRHNESIGNIYWSTAMQRAAKGGHFSTVLLCATEAIDAGEHDSSEQWDWAMYSAAAGGHMELVHYCETKGATDWEDIFLDAAFDGNEYIVRLAAEKGEENWDMALECAAGGGHIKIALICEQNGASDWETAMAEAASCGHKDFVLFCETKGATNWDEALTCAITNNHMEIARLCEKRGAALSPEKAEVVNLRRRKNDFPVLPIKCVVPHDGDKP